MRRRRRNIEAFSLSFLDCICCGFGAIILLLVLSKIYEPVIIEKTQQDLEELIALLQQELFEIRGQTVVLNRDLVSVREQTSTSKINLARLQGELDTVHQGPRGVDVRPGLEGVFVLELEEIGDLFEEVGHSGCVHIFLRRGPMLTKRSVTCQKVMVFSPCAKTASAEEADAGVRRRHAG